MWKGVPMNEQEKAIIIPRARVERQDYLIDGVLVHEERRVTPEEGGSAENAVSKAGQKKE